jgi:putative glutamine amidotransferase
MNDLVDPTQAERRAARAPVPILVTTGGRMDDVVGGEVRALHLRTTYTRALAAAGAVALVYGGDADAAAVGAALGAVGGLLLTGGGDVDPVRFGEARHETTAGIDPERDDAELALARAALAAGVPVFGICRGLQLLAVAAGVPLIQDIASLRAGALAHEGRGARRGDDAHRVRLEATTPMGALLRERGGEEIWVNSFHHQAASRVPDGWRAFAWAPDGILEGMERPGGAFAVAVQWHPEDRWSAHAPDRALFEAFVAAARLRLGATTGATTGSKTKAPARA